LGQLRLKFAMSLWGGYRVIQTTDITVPKG
jgi:hypothetical protein